MEKKNNFSFQLDVTDFLPADESEKQSMVIMRESTSFWKDGYRRLKRNKLAMISFVVIVIVLIMAFIVPSFYPYSYEQQIRGSENLGVMEYSKEEIARMEAGEKVFPHLLGTDSLGRDITIRLLMGSGPLLVGIVASVIILVIGWLIITSYFSER